MRLLALCAACVLGSASVLHAADLVSGTWTSGSGTTTRIYVFKVSGDRLTGIVCGRCDDPADVSRIEDGRVLADKLEFFVRSGPGRQRVEATVARNAMTLLTRRDDRGADAPTSTALTRVVRDFELSPQPLPPAPATSDKPPVANVSGRWVSVGRVAQQNWILNVQGNDVWGLVCGPCTPAVVAMIDGHVDGDTVRFYINHIDTPPSATRKGIQRNVMTGTITGGDNANVMKFAWYSEGSDAKGEITMIGPVR